MMFYDVLRAFLVSFYRSVPPEFLRSFFILLLIVLVWGALRVLDFVHSYSKQLSLKKRKRNASKAENKVSPIYHPSPTANPITTFNTEPPMGKSRMNNLENKNSGIDRLWGFLRLGLQSSLDPNKSFLIRDKSVHPNRQKGTKMVTIELPF